MPGVTQYSHYLPKETPLVGLHGIQIEDGILSLGLILLDTLDPQCQKPLEAPTIRGVDVVSKYLMDEAIFYEITAYERERAEILEAIIRWNTVEDARLHKEEIHEKI